MALQDQIKTAQSEGYSSQEIIQFLAQSNPQVKEAVSEGYQPDEIITFLNQTPVGPTNPVMSAVHNLLPSRSTLEAPIKAGQNLGTMVEAGGAGIGNIDAALLPRAANMIPGVNMTEPPLGQSVIQAGQDVNAVENGQAPATTAGKIGKTVGSFFTPTQIALNAAGGAAAPYVADAVGNAASPVIQGLTEMFPKASTWAGMAPKAVSALSEAPEAVSAAPNLEETAQNVAGTVQGLRESGMTAATTGKAALSDETPVVGLKDKLMNYAATIANSPGADEADKAAADYVSKYAKNLDLNPSEQDVQDLISDLDEKVNTKYNKTNPGPLLDAKIGVRRTLSQALQGQNPEYAKAMAQSTATQSPADTLENSFAVGGGNYGDRTIQALKNKAYLGGGETFRALASTPGLSDTIRNAVAKNALQQGLLGRLSLFLAPKVNPAIQGAVQTAPAIGNAAAQTVQGLTQ